MAAATVQRGGLRSRKSGTKRTLMSVPYESSWPPLMAGDNKAILDEIRREFPHSLFQRNSGKRKMDLSSKGMDDTKSKEDKKVQRLCLVVGINEVTRALEKGHLSLALVCRTVKPDILISHLRLLSATRGIPICAVYGLSETLAPILRMKKVGACGFKNNSPTPYFESLVDFVKAKTPEISVPWLKLWSDKDDKSLQTQKLTERQNVRDSEALNDGTEGGKQTSCVDSAERCSTGRVAVGEEDDVNEDKRGHSKQEHKSKRMRLGDTAVEYQAPNVKNLIVEGKKKRKKTTVSHSVA